MAVPNVRVVYHSVLAKISTKKYAQKEPVSVAKIAIHQSISRKPVWPHFLLVPDVPGTIPSPLQPAQQCWVEIRVL